MSQFIKSAGEQVERSIESTLTYEEKHKIAWQIGTVLIAGGLWIAGKVHQLIFPSYESITGIILFLGAIIASYTIFRRAVKGFISNNSEYLMEQLVSLALLASIAKGDYQTAILIPLIMAIVHFLEERSILGAQSAIEGLKTLQAKEAYLVTSDGEKRVKTEKLTKGDIIRVRPGDMIPVDGEIVDGQSSVDQSSLTGETVPEDVTIGNKVYAGTVNIQGILKVRVTKKVNETSLNKIVELLKKTEQSKTSTMQVIEKYSSYYIPLVIIIATGVLFMTQNMNRVIAILVVACPCAQILVSSTAMVASLAVSTRNGILLKNSKFLENLGDVKTVIFDKTGTLTVGNLDIIDVKPLEGVSSNELLTTAASAAWASNHPVSKAIINSTDDLVFEKVTAIKESAGLGVTAEASCGEIILGNRGWLEKNGLILPLEPNHYGPVVWIACNNKVLGYILLADYLRDDAKEALLDIKELGIDRIILVTGDRSEAAQVIKKELNLDKVFAGCLPSDKLKIVEEEIEGDNITMVVGDGINDALALSKADVGVAMGAMGSNIAVQSADIALMGNELNKLSFIIQLSRRTKTIIHQNLAIASLTSIVMMFLAGVGIITPLTGAFLHNAGAFMVLFNSARLLKFDQKDIYSA
jgi:heavy metal translocating P-type ATPase